MLDILLYQYIDMIVFLGYMDQIWFTDFIVIVLSKFRDILSLCMERYQ